MKRILYICIAALIIIGIIFLFRFFVSKKNEAVQPSVNVPSLPVVSPTVPPKISTGEKITVGTAKGSVVVRNFYKNPVRTTPGFEVVIKETDKYSISYYPWGGGFFEINVPRATLDTIKAAEEDFLDNLLISKTDACFLNVFVVIPYDNAETVVQDLSFCPKTLQ